MSPKAIFVAACVSIPSVFALGMLSLIGCFLSVGAVVGVVRDLIFEHSIGSGNIHSEPLGLLGFFVTVVLAGPCGVLALALLTSVTMHRLERNPQMLRVTVRRFWIGFAIGFPLLAFCLLLSGLRFASKEGSVTSLIAGGWLILPLLFVLAVDVGVLPWSHKKLDPGVE